MEVEDVFPVASGKRLPFWVLTSLEGGFGALTDFSV